MYLYSLTVSNKFWSKLTDGAQRWYGLSTGQHRNSLDHSHTQESDYASHKRLKAEGRPKSHLASPFRQIASDLLPLDRDEENFVSTRYHLIKRKHRVCLSTARGNCRASDIRLWTPGSGERWRSSDLWQKWQTTLFVKLSCFPERVPNYLTTIWEFDKPFVSDGTLLV